MMQLKDICELIVDCEHKTAPTQDSGYPSIRTPNIGRGFFLLEGVNRVSEETYQLWSRRAVPQPGDLIMAREAPVGNVAMIPIGLQPCLGQRTLLIRPNRKEVEPAFLNYLLNGPYVQAAIQAKTNGATVPHLNMKDVRTLLLPPLPPRPIQHRIAGILSAYDELIEISQRRIKILESMARALYREWFVHFRFPGHESVPRVRSPLGDIPQGWEVKKLADITTKIGSGATPRGGKNAYRSEGIHLIRSLNIYDYSFEFENLACIDDEQAADLDNVKVEENDVLLNITGASVARCALVPSQLLPARVNQHVAIVRADPMKVSPYFVLDTINSEQRKLQLLTLAQGGATREALTKDTVSNFEIVLPPSPLMRRYDEMARGIHKQREVLLRQIQNLRRTRDLLLPRLLSGQIEVKAA
ncbi:MAG: restriction endonuclease subunit S [Alphaproteobacteria bacterium]